MSVFPLNIPEKINSPELLAFFQQFGLDRYLSAEEINKITAALAELNEVSGNVSIINTIFVNNDFDKTGQLFTGFANSQWNINGFNYANPTDQEITIPLCSTGKERTDRIVLDTNNNFARIQGIEVDENPVPPAKPANTLDYTLIPVKDTEVGDPTPPILGSNFNKKIYDNFYTYTGTGTDVVIPLPHDGQSNIYLTGSMTSVAGFDFSEFLANPTNAEYPHTGKKFMLTNLSGHDITLLNGVGTLDVFFDLIGGTDVVIPDGKSVFFNGNTNVFVEIDRNWIDTSNKLDKVTTNDVEKVYIKNADGSQSTKPTSDFGTVKGTGTINRISKFTASGTIGDSQIFDNGTNVGIGTTSPQARLDVRAQGVLATDIVLRVRNSTDTQNFLVVNGAGDVYNNGAKGVNTNTFFGENVGRNATGGYNTAIGQGALQNNTAGGSNAAIGTYALQNNTAGGSNMAIGQGALYTNTTGNSNAAIGVIALLSNTTGNSNAAIGVSALGNNTTGFNNAAIGTYALLANTTGNSNTAIGVNAGSLISNGSNNTITNNSIFIGGDTRALADNQTNQIVIGYNAIGQGSNSVVLGNNSITRTQLRGQVIMGAFESAPKGIEGAIYYDYTTKRHYAFDGTIWNGLY